MVVSEALAGGADLFVTGGAALLRLGAVGTLRIVSPRRLREVLRAADSPTGVPRASSVGVSSPSP